MKRTLLLTLVLLILGGVAYYLVQSDRGQKSSIYLEGRDFSVEDRNQVHTVLIVKKDHPPIHLSKKNGEWLYNTKYPTNNNVMVNILNCLSNMKVAHIPTTKQLAHINNGFDKHSMRITAYNETGTVLTEFDMGPNASGGDGSYCRIVGQEAIYAVNIGIDNQGLRPYFDQTEQSVRDKIIFAYTPEEIEEISVDYPRNKIDNYMLSKEGDIWTCTTENGAQDILPKLVEAYLLDFKRLAAVSLELNNPEIKYISEQPESVILTIKADGKTDTYKYYGGKDLDQKVHMSYKWEYLTREELFFIIENSEKLYTTQPHMIMPHIRRASYFKSK